MELTLKQLSSLKLPFHRKDAKKIKNCAEIAKTGRCSHGEYCRYNHQPKRIRRNAVGNYDCDEYRQDNLLIHGLHEFIFTCGSFECASCKMVDGIDASLLLIQKQFLETEQSNAGAMLIIVDEILPKLKDILAEQQVFFLKLLTEKR